MKTIFFIWLFIMSFMYYGIFVLGNNKPARNIIKQATDERGLTSVMFTEGKDTFAIDYMTKPEYVEYFKAGQILYPDYACPDTLIVIDAAGLNKAMAYFEQDFSIGSDADYDSTFHIYCIKK